MLRNTAIPCFQNAVSRRNNRSAIFWQHFCPVCKFNTKSDFIHMRKSTLLLAIAFLIAMHPHAQAQNTAKAMKALEEKNFTEAHKIFREVLILDENDIIGNYGMSRVHSAAASGMKDNEKSLEFLQLAEAQFKAADSKTIDKLAGMGVTKIALGDQRLSLERAFLEEAKKAGTVEAFDAFLARFPESGVGESATNSRNTVAYLKAKALNTLDAYNAFVNGYPQAAEINEAKETRNRLATEVALATNSVAGYREFLEKYHDASQVPQIQQRLNAAAFEETKKVNTVEAWESYIRNYPDSIFLQKAKEQLNYLRAGVDGE
jgi:hypothetical protein